MGAASDPPSPQKTQLATNWQLMVWSVLRGSFPFGSDVPSMSLLCVLLHPEQKRLGVVAMPQLGNANCSLPPQLEQTQRVVIKSINGWLSTMERDAFGAEELTVFSWANCSSSWGMSRKILHFSKGEDIRFFSRGVEIPILPPTPFPTIFLTASGSWPKSTFSLLHWALERVPCLDMMLLMSKQS